MLTGYIISNQILPKIERVTTIIPSVIYHQRRSPPTGRVYDTPENRENCYNNLFDDGDELVIGRENNYEVAR